MRLFLLAEHEKRSRTIVHTRCIPCQQNKSSTTKPAGLLHLLPMPDERGNSITMDFIGPLPEGKGFNCLLTITDCLGSDIRLIPTRTDITAEKLATIFFENWYCKNGLPADIVSDRDKLFISKFWHALCCTSVCAPNFGFHLDTATRC